MENYNCVTVRQLTKEEARKIYAQKSKDELIDMLIACNEALDAALLAKNKMRYVGKEEVEVAPEREWRMVPSEKWAQTLGVEKFDSLPEYKGEDIDYARVEVLLRQHIGAPSVPIVQDGDKVERGDKIAESGDGLSLPLYAPISGYVTLQNGEKIIIDKVNNNV